MEATGTHDRADGSHPLRPFRPAASAALRLLSEDGRLETRRPLVVLGAIAARLAGRGVAVWPEPVHPLVAVDLGGPEPAAWIERTFFRSPASRPGLLRRAVGEATWNGLRAGALVVGPPSSAVLDVCARALGRPLRRPLFALYSPSGSAASKASVFAFEAGSPDPVLLVVGAASDEQKERLRDELAHLDGIRARIGGATDVERALPPAALTVVEDGGELLAAFPVDPLASSTGAEDRDAAFAWLRSFQAATAGPPIPLEHVEWASVDAVIASWAALRPASADAVGSRYATRLAGLAQRELSTCAVHGDFWRGNIAHRDGAIRVYDWEWAQPRGSSVFDPWTYELGALRALADSAPTSVASALDASIDRVRETLLERRLDPELALVLLAPMLGELATRVRRATGEPGPAEPGYAVLMEVAEARCL